MGLAAAAQGPVGPGAELAAGAGDRGTVTGAVTRELRDWGTTEGLRSGGTVEEPRLGCSSSWSTPSITRVLQAGGFAAFGALSGTQPAHRPQL